jgi:hypothetical protein
MLRAKKRPPTTVKPQRERKEAKERNFPRIGGSWLPAYLIGISAKKKNCGGVWKYYSSFLFSVLCAQVLIVTRKPFPFWFLLRSEIKYC